MLILRGYSRMCVVHTLTGKDWWARVTAVAAAFPACESANYFREHYYGIPVIKYKN